jgi:ATP-dependent Lhr-like helicase
MTPFSTPTRTWFEEAFPAPTTVQERGWVPIARGEHALLVAPTGSGKTLAAFLWAIDRTLALPADASPGVRVLYVSPLKALVYDVERNLRAPLVGIGRTAERLGQAARGVEVAVRTGDTPQQARRRQARSPADILVTTPESLFLVLGSAARETLRTVHTVIVDEVHALASVKRGVHLALSLERLAALADGDPQRIGLSATVRPLDEVARFLGGDREVAVVDAGERPHLDLQVSVPVPDMEHVPAPPAKQANTQRGGSILGELSAREVATPPPERGIWAALYPALLARIRAARSTIVFVNSRGLAERLAQRLNETAGEDQAQSGGEPLVLAHHGSISHARRAGMEDALKRGAVRGIVATSSLELGIDMGAVDQVLLVESPGSVARGLQRAGRAGHRVGEVSVARLYPKFRGDLLECAVVAQRMREGAIEALRVPRNALDVLAQQVVAVCVDAPRSPAEVATLVRRAYPYRDLSDAALESVLDMLSGQFAPSELADLRPRLAWDRARDLLSARRGAALVARLNAGTIPDRGAYAVHVGEDGPRVGELDEEMVFETRAGDNLMLGASTWRVEAITRDRVIVAPAPGEPGRLPFWRGDGPGRPLELGQAVGALVRRLGGLSREKAAEWAERHLPLDAHAAANLAAYIHDQKAHTGVLPTDRAIVVERFRDELGDWRVCLLTPFGARLHAPWAMALQQALSERGGFDVQVMYTDDGIVLRLADVEETPGLEVLLPDPDAVEEALTEQLPHTALFASLFRENAVRALLMPRRSPGQRNPLWAQRIKSAQLLASVRRYASFPVVLETYRQALSDVFDLPGLKDLLARVRAREIRVHDVRTRDASPFARSLVFAYVAAYLYEQDAPLAERKAQALTLDRGLLAELLGQAELRELIDPGVLEALAAELAHLTEDRRARDADELHDLLRRLGDLSEAECAARCTADPAPWLDDLAAQRRAVTLTVAGEGRWVAAEEAGLYRDALGCMPPPGLPEAFIAPVEGALAHLVRRYARGHGPFTAAELAARYALRPAQVEPVLALLERDGIVVRGEIRPRGSALDWCDVEVLRRLKRRTLARLRHQVAAVDPRALGRFLPDWHGIGAGRGGPERLEEVVAQLEGLPLPWSTLATVILPARVAGFGPDLLDVASATGRIVWVGRGALGPGGGRIALYRRERAGELLETTAEMPGLALTDTHRAILEHLAQRGASFLVALEQAVLKAAPDTPTAEFEAALWDLVWAGRITNDTFAPLRALGRRAPSRPRRRGVDPLAGGRWSLVEELLAPGVSATERALARAHMLLERYGIVSREAAAAEDLPGGFAPVQQALKAMEEAGKVRRGYFVEGLAGTQFALAGSVDRLRAAAREQDQAAEYAELGPDEAVAEQSGPPPRLLAAVDPANPYGALLPWPISGAGEAARPRRVPGAWVMLVAGAPRLYVPAGGKALLTFPDPADEDHRHLSTALRALAHLPRAGRRRALVIEKVDGVPVWDCPLHALLRECGFQSDYRGLVPVQT